MSAGALPNVYLTPKEQITAATALISRRHDIKYRVCRGLQSSIKIPSTGRAHLYTDCQAVHIYTTMKLTMGLFFSMKCSKLFTTYFYNSLSPILNKKRQYQFHIAYVSSNESMQALMGNALSGKYDTFLFYYFSFAFFLRSLSQFVFPMGPKNKPPTSMSLRSLFFFFFNSNLAWMNYHPLFGISSSCMFTICCRAQWHRETVRRNSWCLTFSAPHPPPRRDDCSLFDGLMEEDEKDKAKR